MANYYATARSNYFAVKDEKAFREWAGLLGLAILESSHHDMVADSVTRFAITPEEHSDNGGWPNGRYDEATGDYVDFDLFEQVATHLTDDEVAVLVEVGNERLRYVSGLAIAVNNKGETVSVDLESIYESSRVLGGSITRAEY